MNLYNITNLLQNNKWFDSIEMKDNKCIIYVHFMDKTTFTTIPDYINNNQVLIYYTAYKNANKSKFVNSILENSTKIKEEDDIDVDINIDILTSTLNKLLQNNSFDIIDSIFFEVHDDQNAITNVSVFYPHVKEKIQEMMNIFGFDIFFEELNKRKSK